MEAVVSVATTEQWWKQLGDPWKFSVILYLACELVKFLLFYVE